MEKADSNYPSPEIFGTSLNGKQVTFVGIYHTPEYFLLYQSVLEEVIRNNAVIVPEALLSEQGYNDNDIENIPDGGKFYGMLSQIIAQENRQLTVVDPFVDIAPLALGVFLGTVGSINFLVALMKIGEYLLDKKQVTRRGFLRTTFMAAAAYSLTSTESYVPGFSLIKLFQPDMHRKYGIDDKLAYGLLNYRNICVARGLDKLTKITPEQTIAIIYGTAHSKIINSYIQEHPTERDIKMKLYAPFNLVSEPYIRNYNFQNGIWVLQNKIPY